MAFVTQGVNMSLASSPIMCCQYTLKCLMGRFAGHLRSRGLKHAKTMVSDVNSFGHNLAHLPSSIGCCMLLLLANHHYQTNQLQLIVDNRLLTTNHGKPLITNTIK